VYVFVHGDLTYIPALYVDDILLAGLIGDFIARFKDAFGSRCDLQDLEHVSWVISTTMVRDLRAHVISLGQRQYIFDNLEHFNMGECNPVGTPLVKDGIESHESSIIRSDLPYNNLIGSLQYAAIPTRPNIGMTMSHLNHFLCRPNSKHWEGGKRVLRYLKGTIELRLVFGGHDSCTLT